MKKIILTLIIIGLAFGGYYFLKNSKNTKVSQPTSSENLTFKPDPSNATFSIDDETITLSQGKNEKPTSPGSPLLEETILLDKFAYGDLNKDGKNDVALLLEVSGGGSGTFIYIASFVSGLVNYKGSNAIFVGDRINPKSISIKNGVVTLNYLDRKPDEAFAAEPTVLTIKQYIYKNGEFKEI